MIFYSNLSNDCINYIKLSDASGIVLSLNSISIPLGKIPAIVQPMIVTDDQQRYGNEHMVASATEIIY